MKNKPNLMKYKGFYGSVDYSLEDSVLYGKIECINDLVTYEAETVKALKQAFNEAVDDYLDTCKELDITPNKSMSGSFNVRVGKSLHKAAYLYSKDNNLSLNDIVKTSLEEKLSTNKQMHVHLHIEKKHSEQIIDADYSSTWINENSFILNANEEHEKVH